MWFIIPKMLDTNKFSLTITGEWPGAGQSTTAKLIAKKLKLERVYAGYLFRKFAHAWNIHKKKMSWNQFEDAIANQKIDLDKIDFSEKKFNEKLLHSWQKDIRQSKDLSLWDKIIDLQSFKALQKPGMVVEAKVGVVVDKIDFGLPKQKRSHKIYKFLLTCTPEVSAQRVLERKVLNREIDSISKESPNYQKVVQKTRRDLIKRHLSDWKRYKKIYNLDRDLLYQKDIFQIDTSAQNQNAVVNSIIQLIKIHQKAQ